MASSSTSRAAGGALSGAGSGALAGAAVGGPWGAVIGGAIGGVAGGVGGYMSGQIDDAALARAEKIRAELEAKWQTPEFQNIFLTPEDYQVVAQVYPQIATYIQENHPEMVQEADSQGLKNTQNQSLEQLARLGETGDDAISKAAVAKAQYDADQASRSQRANLLRDLGSRGLGTSGAEILADTGSQQSNEQNARMAGLQAASDAQNRRVQALSQAGSLAGQIRGQNQAVETQNVSAMNAFNQRMAQSKQLYENQKTQALNEAQAWNAKNTQDTANNNVSARNQFAQYNLNRADNNANTIAQSNNTKLMASNGMGLANSQMQANAAQNTLNTFMGPVAAAPGLAMQYAAGQRAQDRLDALKASGTTPATATSTSAPVVNNTNDNLLNGLLKTDGTNDYVTRKS